MWFDARAPDGAEPEEEEEKPEPRAHEHNEGRRQTERDPTQEVQTEVGLEVPAFVE